MPIAAITPESAPSTIRWCWDERNMVGGRSPKRSSIPDGIQPFVRYHLKLLAYGCQIVAAMTSAAHPSPESIAITDPGCVTSGRVGLRSYRSGGTWSNVVVRPADHDDLMAMLSNETDRGVSRTRHPSCQ